MSPPNIVDISVLLGKSVKCKTKHCSRIKKTQLSSCSKKKKAHIGKNIVQKANDGQLCNYLLRSRKAESRTSSKENENEFVRNFDECKSSSINNIKEGFNSEHLKIPVKEQNDITSISCASDESSVNTMVEKMGVDKYFHSYFQEDKYGTENRTEFVPPQNSEIGKHCNYSLRSKKGKLSILSKGSERKLTKCYGYGYGECASIRLTNNRERFNSDCTNPEVESGKQKSVLNTIDKVGFSNNVPIKDIGIRACILPLPEVNPHIYSCTSNYNAKICSDVRDNSQSVTSDKYQRNKGNETKIKAKANTLNPKTQLRKQKDLESSSKLTEASYVTNSGIKLRKATFTDSYWDKKNCEAEAFSVKNNTSRIRYKENGVSNRISEDNTNISQHWSEYVMRSQNHSKTSFLTYHSDKSIECNLNFSVDSLLKSVGSGTSQRCEEDLPNYYTNTCTNNSSNPEKQNPRNCNGSPILHATMISISNKLHHDSGYFSPYRKCLSQEDVAKTGTCYSSHNKAVPEVSDYSSTTPQRDVGSSRKMLFTSRVLEDNYIDNEASKKIPHSNCRNFNSDLQNDDIYSLSQNSRRQVASEYVIDDQLGDDRSDTSMLVIPQEPEKDIPTYTVTSPDISNTSQSLSPGNYIPTVRLEKTNSYDSGFSSPEKELQSQDIFNSKQNNKVLEVSDPLNAWPDEPSEHMLFTPQKNVGSYKSMTEVTKASKDDDLYSIDRYGAIKANVLGRIIKTLKNFTCNDNLVRSESGRSNTGKYSVNILKKLSQVPEVNDGDKFLTTQTSNVNKNPTVCEKDSDINPRRYYCNGIEKIIEFHKDNVDDLQIKSKTTQISTVGKCEINSTDHNNSIPTKQLNTQKIDDYKTPPKPMKITANGNKCVERSIQPIETFEHSTGISTSDKASSAKLFLDSFSNNTKISYYYVAEIPPNAPQSSCTPDNTGTDALIQDEITLKYINNGPTKQIPELKNVVENKTKLTDYDCGVLVNQSNSQTKNYLKTLPKSLEEPANDSSGTSDVDESSRASPIFYSFSNYINTYDQIQNETLLIASQSSCTSNNMDVSAIVRDRNRSLTDTSIRYEGRDSTALMHNSQKSVNEFDLSQISQFLPLSQKEAYTGNGIQMKDAFLNPKEFIMQVHKELDKLDNDNSIGDYIDSQIMCISNPVDVRIVRNSSIGLEDKDLTSVVDELQSVERSLCQEFSFTPGPIEQDHRNILYKIKQLFKTLCSDLQLGRKLCIELNRRVISNTTFEDGILLLKSTAKCSRTYLHHKRNTKFCLMIYLLKRIHTIIVSKTTVNRREIYYEIYEFIKNPNRSQEDFHDVCCLLNEPPWNLGITTTRKGLVHGQLKLTIDGTEIDCHCHGGALIPDNLGKLTSISATASFILIVEKDTIFQKLLKEGAHDTLSRPFIVITAKGYPDINSRRFIKVLWMLLKIPVFILTDGDPDGIDIMLSYKYGSIASAYISRYLAIPQLKWLGVHPSEMSTVSGNCTQLSKRESKKIQHMLQRPYMTQDNPIRKELEILLSYNKKTEIEGIAKSARTLSNFYLKKKISTKDFI